MEQDVILNLNQEDSDHITLNAAASAVVVLPRLHSMLNEAYRLGQQHARNRIKAEQGSEGPVITSSQQGLADLAGRMKDLIQIEVPPSYLQSLALSRLEEVLLLSCAGLDTKEAVA